jgi:DNA-binding transcriptional MerR regulator
MRSGRHRVSSEALEAGAQHRDDGTGQDKPLKSASKAAPLSQFDPERLYGIAELAEEFGISTRAIRFYEAKELLAPPRVNSGRVYTRRERARLKLILRAKSIGFSLAEIRQFLDLYGDRGEGRPLQAGFLAERSGALIAELEEKQANIAATLKELRVIRGECLQYLNESGTAAVGIKRGASNKTRQ